MRHLSLRHRPPRRAPTRGLLSVHRPRPPTWDRVRRNRRDLRLSDIILGMLGLTLLGALGIMAGAALLGCAPAP